jgi:hypothetical protein
MKHALLIVLAAAAALPAAPAQAASDLVGRFEATINSPNPTLNARWVIRIGPAGRYVVRRNGGYASRGRASTSNGRIVFRDRRGPLRCRRPTRVGTYEYSVADGEVTFTLVKDSCAGRRGVLTTEPLRRLGG